ncbi:MAG: hypothetical protein JNM89_06920 [Hyphomicrobiaceae bacterium]|nr:hypothetical protein [Hyphomicrobiaceae bacterium]
MTTTIRTLAAAILPLALAGCAGSTALPSLSTGSVSASAPPAAAPVQNNTPTTRALQVGSTSARAAKCGFNFDPVRLKAQFMASETTIGTPVADLGKVEKVYDVAVNGISRGVAEKQDYCTEGKTKEIKEDLTRHLAGDYSPRPTKVAEAKDDGGIFGGFFDGDADVDNGPKIGTPEWWEKQKEKSGK